MTRTYRFAMFVCSPLIRIWGRLEVSGLEHLPATGAVLLAANHDSHWDPVAIGVAARSRRQIQALAKSSLWKTRGLAMILDRMGQIPIHRGAGDAHALDSAIAALQRDCACIGVFPEGTISFGKPLRARAGFGRLAAAVPDADVVCATVEGTVDLVRFPRRPRIRVHFFTVPLPKRGTPPGPFTEHLMAEIRQRAPYAPAGRRR